MQIINASRCYDLAVVAFVIIISLVNRMYNKNKIYVIGAVFLAVLLLLLYFLGEIILPFILAVFVAFILNPVIEKIQTKIKNRTLAVSTFLVGIFLLIFNITLFLGDHIIDDSKRFVSSVEVFMDKNEDKINEVKNNIMSLWSEVSENEFVKQQLENENITTENQQENIMSALESIYSVFKTPDTKITKPQTQSWSLLYMLLYLIIYTVIILYTYDYFEEVFNKIFRHKKLKENRFFQDFKVLFVDYFRQRTKVVIISSFIFILAFSFLNLPGAILIGIIAGLLTYASEFHYFSLPLTLIGCWVLSVEQNTSFFVFFGIVLLVYIVISILEETLFFNKIMKSVSGMNPAITILSFAVWTAIFGGFIGTVIALPLTQILMIYGKHWLLRVEEN